MIHQPTEPRPPDAWLLVAPYRFNDEMEHIVRRELPKKIMRRVIGVFSSPQDQALQQRIAEDSANASFGNEFRLELVKDDPSLDVQDASRVISSPACLTVRDNWFLRYASVLEKHLREPGRAQVFTFSPGDLSDPLATHKSTAHGPFPWPRGCPIPKCLYCKAPLGFLGLLDFRQFSVIRVPRGSLIFHGCPSCEISAGEGSYCLTWLTDASSLEFHSRNSPTSVLVGVRWEVTDYPPIGLRPEDVTNHGPFLYEYSFRKAVTCFADKVGGHVCWIQHDETPCDSQGTSMEFIGQFLGTPEVPFGDSGIAYIFFSEETGETKMVMQSF